MEEEITADENTAVIVKDVSVCFNLSKEKVDSLKEFFIKFLKHQIKYDEFWALKNISFTLNKGDRLGILGLNGAGKSTLLKVIAQVYKPSSGQVYKCGVLAPLLELGAGFDVQYTARENIYLYGAVLGYSKKFIDEKFQEIVDFSELERFIDVPLKNYSSGMKSRLGFAICTAVEPDILILDEVLSVGDAKFKKKSEARIQEMFNRGVTVLFVSHSIEQVKKICNKAMILDHGEMKAFGEIEEVCSKYEEMVK
ncbi:MAG: ABC transporter ATP-binding protein [Treponema sp.]|nr:ABC transporter ATP-binding protein [Treponema sp.]